MRPPEFGALRLVSPFVMLHQPPSWKMLPLKSQRFTPSGT
jgi:hypothetical protein